MTSAEPVLIYCGGVQTVARLTPWHDWPDLYRIHFFYVCARCGKRVKVVT